MKLTITKGLPASGKTTWAKKQNAHRINKDDLRAMLNNGVWSKHNEKHILEVRDMLAKHFLMTDHDVIIDDTNLHPKHEQNLRTLVDDLNDQGFNITFHVKDFTDVPLDVCLERDKKREKPVGRKVIKRMHRQFFKEDPKPLDIKIFDPALPYCVIFDLDGTLATIGDRSPYNGQECLVDYVNTSVRELYWKMTAGDTKAIIFSGRNGESEPETREWLRLNDIKFDELHMREIGDQRKDSIIKEEMFDKYIRDKYNVIMVVDDRDQVVDMWRKLGLTCLQVNEGDF